MQPDNPPSADARLCVPPSRMVCPPSQHSQSTIREPCRPSRVKSARIAATTSCFKLGRVWRTCRPTTRTVSQTNHRACPVLHAKNSRKTQEKPRVRFGKMVEVQRGRPMTPCRRPSKRSCPSGREKGCMGNGKLLFLHKTEAPPPYIVNLMMKPYEFHRLLVPWMALKRSHVNRIAFYARSLAQVGRQDLHSAPV